MTLLYTLIILTIHTSLSWWIIALIALVIVLSAAGIVGAVVPAVPGTSLNMAALIISYLLCPGEISTHLLLALLIAGVIVIILDYVAPIWMTRAGGGSKSAVWGSTIGLVAGLFFMPIGLIVGPLIGAFVGEITDSHRPGKAIKVSLWSFAAFLLTTGIKLMAGIVISYYSISAIYYHFT